MGYPHVTDRDRMARINQDIRNASDARRAFLNGRFGELGVEGADVEAALRVCDAWALSSADIDAVLFGYSAKEGGDCLARLKTILRIASTLSDHLDHDQIRCARWIRRATMDLEGFRPLDCLKGDAEDLSRVYRVLTK